MTLLQTLKSQSIEINSDGSLLTLSFNEKTKSVDLLFHETGAIKSFPIDIKTKYINNAINGPFEKGIKTIITKYQGISEYTYTLI